MLKCLLAEHPDANKSNASWASSEKGKAWKAKGKHELPWSIKLDGTTWEDAPERPAFKEQSKLPANYCSNCSDDQLNSIIDNTILNLAPGHNISDVEIKYLANLHDKDNVFDTDLVSFVILQSNLKSTKVKTLVDSGALHNNYISKKLVDKLGLAVDDRGYVNLCGGTNNSCKLIKSFETTIETCFFDDLTLRISDPIKMYGNRYTI